MNSWVQRILKSGISFEFLLSYLLSILIHPWGEILIGFIHLLHPLLDVWSMSMSLNTINIISIHFQTQNKGCPKRTVHRFSKLFFLDQTLWKLHKIMFTQLGRQQYRLVRLISSSLHNSLTSNWYGGHQLDHQSSASPGKLGLV